MKVMEIYEPSMCCATGVCGPSVDTELLRITGLMNQLNKEEKQLVRYNLTDHPMAYVENTVVNQLLNEKGTDVLPITVVDGNVVKTGSYPSNSDIEQLLSITLETATPVKRVAAKRVVKKAESSCCCNDGCC